MAEADETNHKNRLIRILQRSFHPLILDEIALTANGEIIGREKAYSKEEIRSWLAQMQEVHEEAGKYSLKK